MHLWVTLYSSYQETRWSPEFSVQSRTCHSFTLVSQPRTGPATFNSVIYGDRTLNSTMRFTIDNARARHATRADLTIALSHPHREPHGVSIYVGAETSSLETALTEPAFTTNKETTASLLERVMAAHRVTKANKYMAGTAVESDPGL